MVIGAHPMRIPEILARREAANVQVLESWEMQQLLDPERLPQHRDVLQGLRSFLGASLGSEVIIAIP
jgi:hypothetical protein